jgi:CRISPR-associated endonuclease Cas2
MSLETAPRLLTGSGTGLLATIGSGSHTARPTLVAYDIRSDQRRARALKVIERFRCGGQKSMHECWLSIREAHSLAAELADVLDLRSDRALMAWPKLHAGVYCRSPHGAQPPFAALPSSPPARAPRSAVMPAASWHLLAYDVVCPRRLQRVCKLLQKRAQHTQLSLFLLNLPRAELQECVAAVTAVLKADDDLRLYGIDAPELLWQIGTPRQPGLITPKPVPQKSDTARTLWQQLRARFRASDQATPEMAQRNAQGGRTS